MKTAFTIRPYNDASDRQAVIALWERIFPQDSPRNIPAVSIDRKLKYEDGLFFVAATDSVLGTVMAGYDGHRGWIYSLGVEPGFRKQGIGSALLKHAEQVLLGLGCPKINLQVLPANKAVTAFYEKLGYKIEERISMGKKL